MMLTKFRTVSCILILMTNIVQAQLYLDFGLSAKNQSSGQSGGIMYDLFLDSSKHTGIKSGVIIQNFTTDFIGVKDIYFHLPFFAKIKLVSRKDDKFYLIFGIMHSNIIEEGETKKQRISKASRGYLLGWEYNYKKFVFSFFANLGNKPYYKSLVKTWYFDEYYVDHNIDQLRIAFGYKIL